MPFRTKTASISLRLDFPGSQRRVSNWGEGTHFIWRSPVDALLTCPQPLAQGTLIQVDLNT